METSEDFGGVSTARCQPRLSRDSDRRPMVVKSRRGVRAGARAVADGSLRLRYSTRGRAEEIRGKKGSTSLSLAATSRVAPAGREALLSRTRDCAFNWPAIQAAIESEVTSQECGKGLACSSSSSSRIMLVTRSGMSSGRPLQVEHLDPIHAHGAREDAEQARSRRGPSPGAPGDGPRSRPGDACGRGGGRNRRNGPPPQIRTCRIPGESDAPFLEERASAASGSSGQSSRLPPTLMTVTGVRVTRSPPTENERASGRSRPSDRPRRGVRTARWTSA